MDEKQLPDGFMFNPTDIELVGYYLRRKLSGKKLPSVVIPEVDVYKFAPWDLPDMAGWKGEHQSKWHFFCPRSSKYHHSSSGRGNRVTDIGFWKTTGKDRAVSCKDGVVGMHKTLIFYLGRPPSGERTDWIMHEYRIDEQVSSAKDHEFVLCVIFRKDGTCQKTSLVMEEAIIDDDDSPHNFLDPYQFETTMTLWNNSYTDVSRSAFSFEDGTLEDLFSFGSLHRGPSDLLSPERIEDRMSSLMWADESLISGSGPGGGANAGGAEKKSSINQELWQACAGPSVNLPAAGTLVYYFPQGHSEQVAAMKKNADAQIPNYQNLPSKLLCLLHSVILQADPKTDEVYAQMTLEPVPSYDREALLRSDLSLKSNRPQPEFFCKTLTASDTSTHGGFSVPRRAAEIIFPPLDYSMQRPAQELMASDLHGNVWNFRHIYRGQPRRHLLTTGWSLFVSEKRLSAGDSVLFIRDEKQQLLLGIRRANRQSPNLSSSVLSHDSMHIGILAHAAHAASNNSRFTIFFNPWASPSEFVIPLAKYYKAVYSNQVSLGPQEIIACAEHLDTSQETTDIPSFNSFTDFFERTTTGHRVSGSSIIDHHHQDNEDFLGSVSPSFTSPSTSAADNFFFADGRESCGSSNAQLSNIVNEDRGICIATGADEDTVNCRSFETFDFKTVDLLLPLIPSISIALNLRAECLVKVYLPCSNDVLVQDLVNLKQLDLSCSSFTRMPDLSRACKLQSLDLHCCKNLADVSSIQYLTKLEYINLKGCTSLTRLPSLMALKFLLSLDVSDCINLRRLPPSLGCLSSLTALDIRNCKRIQNLPKGILRLKSVQTLSISGCSMLMEQASGPDGMLIENQVNLIVHSSSHASDEQTLSISGCSMLMERASGPEGMVIEHQVNPIVHSSSHALDEEVLMSYLPVDKYVSKIPLQQPEEERIIRKYNSMASKDAAEPSSTTQDLELHKEVLKAYMNMPVEKIHQANAFYYVQRTVDSLIRRSPNSHESTSLHDLTYCLEELQENVPETMSRMHDARVSKASIQVKLAHLHSSFVQSEGHYNELAARLSVISDEEEDLDAEIDRLLAKRRELLD